MVTKLNININDETDAALKDLAGRRQITVTEVVRRAVSVYKYIEDEVVDGDAKLKLVKPTGETEIQVL